MPTCPSSDCSNDKVNRALIKGLDIRIVAVAALTKRLYPSLKVDRGKIGEGARRKRDTGETLKGKNRLFQVPEQLTHCVEDEAFDGENIFDVLHPRGFLKCSLLLSFTFTPSQF